MIKLPYKNIAFCKGQPAGSNKIGFVQYFYNSAEYIEMISGKTPEVFYGLDRKTNRVICLCSFTIIDGIAYSPYSAPFGSIEFSPDISEDVLIDFFDYVDNALKGMGIRKIVIKHYASFQAPHTVNKIKKSFKLSGFKILETNINHHLIVDSHSFTYGIHPMEKRRLNKCKKAGMIIRNTEWDELMNIYEFIASCRAEKQLEINISREDFLKAFSKFPEQYRVFTGLINGKIAAATVIVKVNKEIIYNYLPAFSKAFNTYSPLVMLMEGVYNYAQKNGYKFIDLGVSSIGGIRQEGLIYFKEMIGGVMSEKITFIKALNN